MGKKISQMAKIRVSEVLKWLYCQLWAEYYIRTPKTWYNASMVGYITSMCYMGLVRWPISEILGLKGVKISRNGQN